MKMICITPYKEIRCGQESIYDHVQKGYAVPKQVIAYLCTAQPYSMSPGVYEHPFRPGKRLLGPYLYTDGKYCWDRDTWKYVVKYNLVLPQYFIDHVQSEDGKGFLEKFDESFSWPALIKDWKTQSDLICCLPENAGDLDLEKF